MAVPAPDAARWALLGGLVAHLALVGIEITARGTRHVDLAVAAMTRGREAPRFWTGIALAATAALLTAIALAGVAPVLLTAIAAVAALGGTALYEDAFVGAGQAVPLS
jgi:hypothetical protein